MPPRPRRPDRYDPTCSAKAAAAFLDLARQPGVRQHYRPAHQVQGFLPGADHRQALHDAGHELEIHRIAESTADLDVAERQALHVGRVQRFRLPRTARDAAVGEHDARGVLDVDRSGQLGQRHARGGGPAEFEVDQRRPRGSRTEQRQPAPPLALRDQPDRRLGGAERKDPAPEDERGARRQFHGRARGD